MTLLRQAGDGAEVCMTGTSQETSEAGLVESEHFNTTVPY